MYELTQVEKCRKLPPLWKQFANLRKDNISKQVKKFLKIADKPAPTGRVALLTD